MKQGQVFLLIFFISITLHGQSVVVPDSIFASNSDSWPLEYSSKKKKPPKTIFGPLQLLQVKRSDEVKRSSTDMNGIFGRIQESKSVRTIFLQFLYKDHDTVWVRAEIVHQVSGSGKNELVRVNLGDANKGDFIESVYCSRAYIAGSINKLTWDYEQFNEPNYKRREFLTNGTDTILVTRWNKKQFRGFQLQENNKTIAACEGYKDMNILIAKDNSDAMKELLAAALGVIICAADY